MRSIARSLAASAPVVVVGIAVLAGSSRAQTPTPKPATSTSASASASNSLEAYVAPAQTVMPTITAEFDVAVAKGTTSDAAAQRAIATSKIAKVDDAKVKAAEAAADVAWDAYFPRLTLLARYTRLSPVTYGPITFGTQTFPNPFPVILNSYVLQAAVDVPLTDYAFKIHHQHEAALSSIEASKWNSKVTLLQASAEARVTYYNWLRARGSVVVAKSAVDQANAHLKELQDKLAQKTVTKAEVFNVEAQVAAAELAVVQSESLVAITEATLRQQMHMDDSEALLVGEDLQSEVPPSTYELKSLKANALQNRPELKAVDAQISAAQSNVDVATSTMLPHLDAIADAYYSKPNARFVPQVDEWKATWDIGIQLSWSPNDYLVASDQKKQASADVAVLESTREQLTDAITLEVVTTFNQLREAEAAVVSTGAELRSADEAYRVRVDQFVAGYAKSSLLIDAETDLTRARLDSLNARVDVRIARANLKKAIGQM